MCVVVCEASPGILKAPKTHVAEFMFVLLHVHLHTVVWFSGGWRAMLKELKIMSAVCSTSNWAQ